MCASLPVKTQQSVYFGENRYYVWVFFWLQWSVSQLYAVCIHQQHQWQCLTILRAKYILSFHLTCLNSSIGEIKSHFSAPPLYIIQLITLFFFSTLFFCPVATRQKNQLIILPLASHTVSPIKCFQMPVETSAGRLIRLKRNRPHLHPIIK